MLIGDVVGPELDLDGHSERRDSSPRLTRTTGQDQVHGSGQARGPLVELAREPLPRLLPVEQLPFQTFFSSLFLEQEIR